jgi:hypothetical protein
MGRGLAALSIFPLLGSQLAVGEKDSLGFQINCTWGFAKVHRGFRAGVGLRSHSQLLNPPQTTSQKTVFKDSEPFISLLFLVYLESRNHRRKPIIGK